MPSSQFRDTIELAFNGLILLVLIMAEHYPEFAMIVGACSTTSIEQTFAMARSLIGDCKSSNTFWEFLWKFRSTAVKTTCLDAVKKACNQGPAMENFPENYYPSKIPNLREKIKETINKAKEDCSQRVSHFLTFPNVDQEESEMYQDDIMMEHNLLSIFAVKHPN